ncbi:putative non-chaperonin molecular chaperone ATPase [Medicago truncatula]|uniref:Putative non-chaperonin molecular chaperone ATPase n=1 Tax=Medicago truncatula TaxID=3880 RepID=A0A396GU25_MEDTR|nr:putative non-chaperonin molecular chaperone ATPase [Medicago truncatula]
MSFITLKDGKIEIKAMDEETLFGGEDFNNRMVNHFVKEFTRKHKMNNSLHSRVLMRMRNECERAKRTLSYESKVAIEIDYTFQGKIRLK